MGELIYADFKNKVWKRPTTVETPFSEDSSKQAIEDIAHIAEAAHDAGFNLDLAVIVIPKLNGEMVVQQMGGVAGMEGAALLLSEASEKIHKVLPDHKK